MDISFAAASSGERNVTIGRDAAGNIILTGDGNTVLIVQPYMRSSWLQEVPSWPEGLASNPYKGLEAFTEEDSDRFLGRERIVADLWQLWQALQESPLPGETRRPRLLAVLGPSGSGKSSLVRAGLVPELARWPLLGLGGPRVAILIPGAHPLEALATVLARLATGDPMPVTKAREFVAELALPDGLRRIVDALLGASRSPLVLVVDQFEEIYALCESETERNAFVAGLLAAVADPGGRCSVVLTLRTDFLGATSCHPDLNQLVSSQGAIVPVMAAEELRRAITEPARRAGRPFDESTVELLVKEVSGRAGALPLLQFALTRIWAGLGEGMEPAETLRSLGGIGGALTQEADRLFDSLGEPDKRIARRAFLKMVHLGDGMEDMRRRAHLSEVVAAGEDPERVLSVLRRFARPGERLLTLGGNTEEPTAEITHEVLITAWPTLQGWLREGRNDLRLHRRLAEDAEWWDTQGRPPGLLWRPPDLDLLRNLCIHTSADLTARELAFATESEQEHRRVGRKRKLAFAAAVLMSALLVVGVSYYTRYTRVRYRLLRTQSLGLAELARQEISRGNTTNGILLALEALPQNVKNPDRPYVTEAEAVLQEAIHSPREQIVFRRHDDVVESVVFTPRGLLVAAISQDGSKIWNANTGSLVATLAKHLDSPHGAAFSPDGRRVAVAFSNRIGVWNTRDGSLIATLAGSFSKAPTMVFSPDGSRVVTASSEGVRAWNPDRGSLIAVLATPLDSVKEIAFSPDGSRIAVAANRRIDLLDSVKGTVIATEPIGSVNAIAFDSEGARLAIASYDGDRIWNIAKNSRVTLPKEDDSAVWALAFNPKVSLLATASSDSTIRLRNGKNGELLGVLRGDKRSIQAIKFNPEGSLLVAASDDGAVRIWKIKNDSKFFLAPPYAVKPGPPHFKIDMYVGSLSYNYVRKVGVDFKGDEANLTPADWAGSISFSADGSRLATAAFDGTARIWSTQNGSLIRNLSGHTSWGDAIAFSPDGSRIVTASFDRTARIWNASDGSPIAIISGHAGFIHATAFSPDGSRIVTASDDKTAKIWNAVNGALISTLTGHVAWVRSIAFSADGSLLATGSGDGTARVWNVANGSLIATFPGHSDFVQAIALSPDGSRLATASGDGTARLWDVTASSLITKLTKDEDYVHMVTFSPDGSRLATASGDSTARIWNAEDGSLLATLNGHSGFVSAVAFSFDGSHLASASFDGTVRIWKVDDGSQLVTLTGSTEMPFAISFSPNGTRLAVVNPRGIVYLWHIFSSTQELIDYACSTVPRDLSAEERRRFHLDLDAEASEDSGLLKPGERPRRCRRIGS